MLGTIRAGFNQLYTGVNNTLSAAYHQFKQTKAAAIGESVIIQVAERWPDSLKFNVFSRDAIGGAALTGAAVLGTSYFMGSPERIARTTIRVLEKQNDNKRLDNEIRNRNLVVMTALQERIDYVTKRA